MDHFCKAKQLAGYGFTQNYLQLIASQGAKSNFCKFDNYIKLRKCDPTEAIIEFH